MPIRLKVNPLPLLKEKGYPSTRLFRECFGNSTIQKLRDVDKGCYDVRISMNELGVICDILECQPQTLIEWYPKK